MTVRSIDGLSITQQFNHGSRICTCSFGPDGTLLAMGGESLFSVIDVLSGALVYTDSKQMFACDFISRKAGHLLLASCGENGHAEIRNLGTGVIKQNFVDPEPVDTVLYSPGPKQLKSTTRLCLPSNTGLTFFGGFQRFHPFAK
jgi:hypothetical protein